MKKAVVIGILIAILALGVRIPNAGKFMTVDEQNWMLRSATFWHEIFRQGDFTGTFLTTHPGATTMWIAGSGIFLQESRLGLDVDTSNTQHFLRAGQLPTMIVASVLLGLSAAFVVLLFGKWAGVVVGILLALDPYYVGLSQVIHPDSLLAPFMLAAALAWLVFLKRRKWRWLTVTGVLTGMALATKMLPALWLIVFFGATYFYLKGSGAFFLRKNAADPFVRDSFVRVAGFGIGIAALTFVVLWPALWAKHDNLDQYVEREFVEVVAQEHVAIDTGDKAVSPWTFYGRTLLGRATPATLIGLVAVTGWLVVNRKAKNRKMLWALTLYALGFLALVTFVPKKSDRYAMPGLIMLPVVVGLAAAQVKRKELRIGLMVLVVGLTVFSFARATHPVGYNNIIFADVRPYTQRGWGEGLEGAAVWLNAHPLGDKLTIASWYPSVMRPYFNGKTFSLSSRNDYRVSYVVTYKNMHGRPGDDIASNVLDEFADKEPVYVVYANGEPQAWIYETLNVGIYTKHIGELLPGMAVGQTFVSEEDTFSHVDIGFATFSSRDNTNDIVLKLYDDLEASEPVRTATTNARDIVDNEWHRFEFEEIADAEGGEFYIEVTTPNGRPGNTVTVRYIGEDLASGDMYLVRHPRNASELREASKKTGDIAYRVE